MTSQIQVRMGLARVIAIAGLVLLALLLPGRALRADGPVVADGTIIIETPLIYEPGDTNLYFAAAIPEVGSRDPTSSITASYQDVWPANAQAALEAAIVIIENMVVSDIPIVIEAHWEPIAGSTLGFAGPYFRSFPSGQPFTNTWYPGALYNELLGSDGMNITANNPIGAELKLTMNSSWGTWHYGPGPAPGGKVDFTTVALHELTHGLGITGAMDAASSTTATWGLGTAPNARPMVYDQFTHRGSGSPSKLIDIVAVLTPSTDLMTALKGNAGGVRFMGPLAMAANGGAGVVLHTPSTFDEGASYAHVSEIYNGTVNTLMTFSVNGNETVHDPGPLIRAMLKDLGYLLQDPAGTTGTLQFGTVPIAVSENFPSVNIPVTRTGGSSGEASATCSITGGTASQGPANDFMLTSAAVSWLDGDGSTKNCVVTINNDVAAETDETIQFSLTNIDGATAGSPTTAQLSILASDNAGTLQFTSASATIYRGLGGIALGVSRTGGTDGAVSSGCSAVSGDAVANVDYLAVNSIVAFNDGSSSASQTCIINPIVNLVSPGNRQLEVALSGASGGALIGANSSVTLTIIDPAFDPTCDGDINGTDALALMRALAGYTGGILPTAPCTGDADGSPGVDIGDAVAIRRFVAANN